MAGPTRSSHGSTVRGLTLSRGSKFFGGQFGRMFRALPPADFGESDTKSEVNLLNLGKAMVADHDPPKDGPDAEESGIPAAYTYLGQFIDHDLTFDPASSLQQQDDPDGLVDFRTPRFDLDCVYGKGRTTRPTSTAATTYSFRVGRSPVRPAIRMRAICRGASRPTRRSLKTSTTLGVPSSGTHETTRTSSFRNFRG